MSKPTSSINASNLSLNLNDQAHDLIRELAMASRKMSIYGAGHPLAIKAVEKPFFILNSIFRFKSYINLNVQRGDLFLLNIRLKDSPFNAQILQFMQLLDVNAVLFERSMRICDFSFFIETLVTRQLNYTVNFSFTSHLKKHDVTCVEVNSELAYDLFERRKQYRGDVDGDFSVRRLVLDQLGDDLMRLAEIRNANAEGLLELGIDFDPQLVGYLLPEKMASFDPDRVRQVLTELADQISSEDAGRQVTRDATGDYMALFKLVDYHPNKKDILENLEDRRRNKSADDDIDALSETGAIKIHASARIEELIEKQFSSVGPDDDTEVFIDAFVRLLKTGQQPKAAEVMSRLIDLMSAADPGYRQRALNLLGLTTAELGNAADASVLEAAVADAIAHLEEKTETYEYSEFLWQLFEACRRVDRFDLAASLTQAMSRRRAIIENVTVYDSMAVKKGFENISRRRTVEYLIGELINATGETIQHLVDLLVAVGTEDVAVGLSQIISHPRRQVRQLTLKILAELGKSSLKVFSRIIHDDAMFKRGPDRHELPDENWYVVRNSIFVLGSLHDVQGVSSLRIRIDDKDVRVRREVISALEKIGGEDAVDCLTLMAEDPIVEVGDAAIIAIGLIADPSAAPILIDIARGKPRNSIKAVTALGKLGGDEAKVFLGHLLTEPDKLAELAGGVVGKDDLRVAAVKALGHIGDSDSIEQVRRYKEGLSTTQKILFRNSAVNKVITDVLSRH